MHKLATRFKVSAPPFDYPLRYNIRPGQEVPSILNTNPNEISLGYWGYTPKWAKSDADNKPDCDYCQYVETIGKYK